MRVRLASAAPSLRLQVFSAQGQLLRTQAAPAPGQDALLDVAALPAGLYVLRCGELSQRLTVE